jgi:hypothetical protein
VGDRTGDNPLSRLKRIGVHYLDRNRRRNGRKARTGNVGTRKRNTLYKRVLKSVDGITGKHRPKTTNG